MVLNDVTYAERENAGKAIIEACTAHEWRGDRFYRQLPRIFHAAFLRRCCQTSFAWYSKASCPIRLGNLGADAGGNVTRIDNALEKITEHLANARSQLAHTTEQLENARTEMTAPFPKEAELAEKTRRLNELNVLLNLNEEDRPVMADEPDEGDRIRPKTQNGSDNLHLCATSKSKPAERVPQALLLLRFALKGSLQAVAETAENTYPPRTVRI